MRNRLYFKSSFSEIILSIGVDSLLFFLGIFKLDPLLDIEMKSNLVQCVLTSLNGSDATGKLNLE